MLYSLLKVYCENYDLGLYVVKDNLIEKPSKMEEGHVAKASIGKTIANFKPEVKNVCYLDTDILINPCAPNIFDVYDKKNYEIVSDQEFAHAARVGYAARFFAP